MEKLSGNVGNVHKSNDNLLSLAMNYFHNLFTLNNVENPKLILEGVKSCINQEMNAELEREFTYEEVCVALKFMNPLKASSEDGLGAVFYQWC